MFSTNLNSKPLEKEFSVKNFPCQADLLNHLLSKKKFHRVSKQTFLEISSSQHQQKKLPVLRMARTAPKLACRLIRTSTILHTITHQWKVTLLSKSLLQN